MNRRFVGLIMWAIVAVGSASNSLAGFDANQGDMLKLGEGAGKPGGIFTVDLGVAGTYNGDVDFYTMCVELTEYVSFGTIYKVNNDVENDGFQTRDKNGNGKSLTAQTAWLYAQANLETLPLFGYVPVSIDSDGFFDFGSIAPHNGTSATELTARDAANALQLGIWQGMGWTDLEIAAVDGSNGLWKQSYIDDLTSMYLRHTDDTGWLDMFDADSEWSGVGTVRIMNLVKIDSTDPNKIKTYNQDQLVWMVPPPPPPGSSVPELPTFYTSSALIGALACSILLQRRKLRTAG